MKTRRSTFLMILVLFVAAINIGVFNTVYTSQADFSGPVTGAIFTTTVDGDIVNENTHYTAKEDVYLDGGPGPNAPAGAAALVPGDYYFQVTDPSGKDLLSLDHISCRRIQVNNYGVISKVYEGTNYVWSQGGWSAVPCKHNEGVDLDHQELGAITVQLMPYADTPNKGGVYKVWVTPVDAYTGDPNYIPVKHSDAVNGENYQPANYHGFVPRFSKTDNYKIMQKRPYVSPMIDVKKFHDTNLNAIFDGADVWVTGWAVDVTDPLGVTNTIYTQTYVDASTPGTYTFVEHTPINTIQTASYLDGTMLSSYPTANPQVDVYVVGDSGETHEVVYGDIGLGQITACKIYDMNTNGIADPGETGVPGWKIILTGTQVDGVAVGPITMFTGSDGCATFTNLLPGDYHVEEVMPPDYRWISTGSMSEDVTIVSTLDGSVMIGSSHVVIFTNYYAKEMTVNFDTKGYWHNKNGLQELTQSDIDYVNSLAPYSSPSSYFGAGDEPFDGYYSDGTPVEAAFKDDDGTMIWAAGTFQAEVSHFLVDSNAGGDPNEQLAQQLLAFIFNVQHRAEDFTALIWYGTSWVSLDSLIQDAIAAWLGGNPMVQGYYATLLDYFNNNDSITLIYLGVASPTYPPVTY